MRRTIALLLLFSLFGPMGSPLAQSTSSPASLQPGDVIRVEIWQEKDLSGQFLVDEEGSVTLPLVGPKRIVGIPFRELRGMLIEEYGKHLRNPSVSVIPLRRISVLGEVNKPGVLEVDPTISLAGAVALAGGATANGDLNRIRIVRNGQVLQEKVGGATTLDSVGILSGDQIFLTQRGWFSRNSTFVVSLLFSATSIVISLLSARSNASGGDDSEGRGSD